MHDALSKVMTDSRVALLGYSRSTMLWNVDEDHVDKNSQSWCLSMAPWLCAIKLEDVLVNCWEKSASVALLV